MSVMPIANQSPSQRVKRVLREWIQQGRWAPGERLPTEGDLVESLQVSRGTVRTVLQELQTEGVL